VSAAFRPSDVLARVEAELRAMWPTPAVPGQTPSARTSTMNLVVVAASPELAARWVPVVDDVLLGLPARAIVVGLDPDGSDALEATTSAVCAPPADGPAVCSDRISLVARGVACARLSSCVGTLCVPDVPTTLVWLGRVHADDPAFAPLALEAGRIVLDASQGSLASLAHVVYWARARARTVRPGVADLTWTRLAVWQELCARLFDEPRLQPLASKVARLSLTQASAAGAQLGSEGSLMLGWLATRLGWKSTSLGGRLRLVRPDDGLVQAQLVAEPEEDAPPGTLLAMRLEAAAGDFALHGEIVREAGATEVGAPATWCLEVTSHGATHRVEQRIRLRDREPARLLERTLHRPPHDAALVEAVAWADQLRGEELACL
jgi:glucose-6-phosphate dehydrogenase assembly protein OpcA